MSTVLTVNAGSNSLKADLIDAETEQVLHSAHVEDPPDSDEAVEALTDLVGKADDVTAVAHRLVHGGPELSAPTVVDDDTLGKARRAESLAPLHVPPALRLLERLRGELPDVPHVLCPDTAFHDGLPEHAATYALPAQWRERFGLRRYGFHGLSYGWASDRAAHLLGRRVAELNLVLTHLGGGCSVCAVRGGKSVDTSMGFTPLEGVPMSRRSGSIDPGLLLWLIREGGIDPADLEDALNHRSGLLGLSGGLSGDTRDLVRAAAGGDTAAESALGVFAHRVRREIAAEASALDRLDAVVFTGEIGWDQPEVRAAVAAGLGLLGVRGELAPQPDEDAVISAPDSPVAVLAVQPREDLALVRAALSALG
ncbi:acetate/propionate family kinase [Actinokineospora sp. PR83]|uniref:acetate/propionate family kinase n=1 Tax=Actinokineospora sp. PR83 TaxID=2884908 RepID=UPI0027E017E5|nr:acetate/propionate family kinase [Actinokineospora sp. PR83]MCG8916590.1 acetate/propionate family kinase [Actinokineospora sp. PR83]